MAAVRSGVLQFRERGPIHVNWALTLWTGNTKIGVVVVPIPISAHPGLVDLQNPPALFFPYPRRDDLAAGVGIMYTMGEPIPTLRSKFFGARKMSTGTHCGDSTGMQKLHYG